MFENGFEPNLLSERKMDVIINIKQSFRAVKKLR